VCLCHSTTTETAAASAAALTAAEVELKWWDVASRASFIAVATTSKCLKNYPAITSEDVSSAKAALVAASDAAEKAAKWNQHE